MNPVALGHLIAAGVAIAAAVPLIRRRVKMNPWYGVRIPAAFESEARWFEINHYGGKLLFTWGVVLSAVALVGMVLPGGYWLIYNWGALVVIVGGLAVVIWKVRRHATKQPPV